jgi:hypothetical protein
MIKMEVNSVTMNEPKTKQSALNRCAYFVQQQEIIEGKRLNLMNNISATEEKLKRLEETLLVYKQQLERISSLDTNASEQIKNLQDSFTLTRAEILETKSELLRNQISKLQAQAGVTRTGQKEQF